MGETLACPNDCGRSVGAGKLLCWTCWRRVPIRLQTQVNKTWGAYSRAQRTAPETVPAKRAAYMEARDAALESIRR